jgi:B12 binding protein
MPLKTLFLNPPSFEKFDGGASSRWPATREIESYWYPVWLAYPAGMLEGARLLDAPPHHVSAEETIKICKDYEFLVLFTSTVGWTSDQRLAKAIKAANPSIRIAFVGPPVTTSPDKALNECSALDFICRIVWNAIINRDIPRLYSEARSFIRLRAHRNKAVRVAKDGRPGASA